jgi:iron complex outermembrane receptor protein
MKKMSDRARFAVLLATIAAPFGFAQQALAQDNSANASAGSDEEIVVTARRTEEKLQDVPASVSAFSSDRLDQLGATDPVGLQGAVPNLNIVQGRGSSDATNIFIRGVGQPDALQTFDPAVGFYVDGVYYSRIRGTQLELLDINRVEVLRGPQGTLYGKNTIGGALSIITQRPGQTPHYSMQVTTGDYNLLESRVGISHPITDNMAASLDLFAVGRDGYVTNPVTGQQYNDRHAWGGRTRLAWDVTPDFSLDFSYDYQQENNAMTVGQPTSTLISFAGATPYVAPNPLPTFDFHAQTTPGLPNESNLHHAGGSVTANWQLSPQWTLKSISAYRRLNYGDYIDIDATQYEFGDVFVGVDQNQFSEEVQAIFQSDALTLVSGLYYLREHITSHQEAYADDLVNGYFGLTGFTRTIDDRLLTNSKAAYVNATYAFTPVWNASLGVRYTDEDKDYDRSTSTFYSIAAFDSTFPFAVSDSWSNTSWLASTDYHITDNVMAYARYSQGFMSGGFNGRANNPGEEAPYRPETEDSYEVGAKTDWLDHRLVANVAAFYNKFDDFQARVSGTVIDPITMLPTPSLTIINAGELDISGAELEVYYNPIDPLHLDAEVGYLDASYGSFDDTRFTSFGGSRAFQEPAFSPRWTVRLGASYEWKLPTGSLVLAGDANYRSRMALAVDNTAVNSSVQLPGMFQDAYWLYNASITWNVNDVFSIALQGRNLSDEVYKTDAQEFSSVGNIRTAYYGAPETVNLVLTAKY